MTAGLQILNAHQIEQKVRRLAMEILEEHFNEPQIVLVGINNNGMLFAKMLFDQLQVFDDSMPVALHRVRLSPADPLKNAIELEVPIESLKDQVVIIVDDVCNTGRTVFFAMKPMLETLPKKVEVAVLIDRTHKSYPIRVDFVGLSLATTLKENIDVHLKGPEEKAVFLI